jgi:hypothetical protein
MTIVEAIAAEDRRGSPRVHVAAAMPVAIAFALLNSVGALFEPSARAQAATMLIDSFTAAACRFSQGGKP